MHASEARAGDDVAARLRNPRPRVVVSAVGFVVSVGVIVAAAAAPAVEEWQLGVPMLATALLGLFGMHLLLFATDATNTCLRAKRQIFYEYSFT